MKRTLTLAAFAALVSTSAFAMVPSNEAIKKDIMDLGFSASEVAQIPADTLQGLNVVLSSGDSSDARQTVRSVVASIIYDGGVSAEEFAAWNATNGDDSGNGLVAGVDFERNAFSGEFPLSANSRSDAN
ncbi:MAG: hypothetical protein AAFR98_05995 [Pseudomonadota bacterium]